MQTVAATKAGWRRVSIHAEPGSRCVMHNESGDDLVAFADATGAIDLYVRALNNAQSEVSNSLSCTHGASVQTFPLTYRLGDALPDVPNEGRASVAKSQASLNLQTQAAIARLGFDPRTADIDVLAAHDLPARPNAPTDSSAYLAWLDVATSPATRIVREGVETDMYHGPVRSAIPLDSEAAAACAGCGDYSLTSPNWSGYEGNGYRGTFGVISAQWNMPSAAAQMPSGTYYAATWVGIDGGYSYYPFPLNNPNVFQTGTNTVVYSNGGYQTGVFYIWYEWYPEPWHIAFYTAPYNTDWCEVFKYFSNGRATGEWYCKDQTSGQTEITSRYVDSAMIGDTGEWIVERPEPNINQKGVYAPLVDFGRITLTNAWAQTTTGVWFPYSSLGGPWALYDITLSGNQGIDSYTANPTYLNFDVVYEHSK